MKHVKAVIFDWAGTVVDYGSLAPMGAFVETFAEFGVAISIDEARGPMGMAKRPHIAALVSSPRIAEAWQQRHGHPPTENDIDSALRRLRAEERFGRRRLFRPHSGRR